MDFSGKLGVSSRTIAAYEQGINEPSIDTLISLSEYFGVTVDYLIGNSDVRSVEDQNLSKRFGLNDDAIFRLEQYKTLSALNNHNKTALQNINYVIEDIELMFSISDYLNSYLSKEQYVVCNYYISQNGKDLIYEPEKAEKMLTKKQWENIFLADVQKNLERLRREIHSKTRNESTA